MGNFTNAYIIAICMSIFGQTGASSTLTFNGSRNCLALMYGFGAIAAIVMVWHRFTFLEESKVRLKASRCWFVVSAYSAALASSLLLVAAVILCSGPDTFGLAPAVVTK
jgi:hypothetical protein